MAKAAIIGNLDKFDEAVEDWNGIPRTRVRVTVEMHVFHISSIGKLRDVGLHSFSLSMKFQTKTSSRITLSFTLM